MVSLQDKTTITVSKTTQQRLNLLKLEMQAAEKRALSQDDIVRLALACLERAIQIRAKSRSGAEK